jgi:hypothetical protein
MEKNETEREIGNASNSKSENALSLCTGVREKELFRMNAKRSLRRTAI